MELALQSPYQLDSGGRCFDPNLIVLTYCMAYCSGQLEISSRSPSLIYYIAYIFCIYGGAQMVYALAARWCGNDVEPTTIWSPNLGIGACLPSGGTADTSTAVMVLALQSPYQLDGRL